VPESHFSVLNKDQSTDARSATLRTRRGEIQTPVFMPVGTQAAVKTLTPEEVRRTGSSIILANTYHLLVRPGVETIQAAGGVHSFMGWDGPLLTDSGGFQVFSLAANRAVRERGVEFRSHHDGRKLELTPESVIDLQITYGSDIMMPLDELAGYDSTSEEQFAAMQRTTRWLDRGIEYFARLKNGIKEPPLLFGIAQGGFDSDRRSLHARELAHRDVDGFSIGGLSVGETKDEMMEMLAASISHLPDDRPRYLMGVGSPEDLWRAVSQGVDMFDCVHPTRIARRGALFTREGRVNITAARFRHQFQPLESDCDCMACTEFSAAYVHHLFRSGEMLGPRLASIHNLRFMNRITEEMRSALREGNFDRTCEDCLSRYRQVDEWTAREQRARWMENESRKRQITPG
jgi:queuine tRNA-ribosyltransferase